MQVLSEPVQHLPKGKEKLGLQFPCVLCRVFRSEAKDMCRLWNVKIPLSSIVWLPTTSFSWASISSLLVHVQPSVWAKQTGVDTACGWSAPA